MKRYFQFGLVGAINTVLAYLLFSLMIYLGAEYPFALLLDYIFGSVTGVLLHHRYTFDAKKRISRIMIIQSLTLNFSLFIINVALLYIFIDICSFNTYIAQVAALIVIIFSSYLGLKAIITDQVLYVRK